MGKTETPNVEPLKSSRKPLKSSKHTITSNLPRERLEMITSINQRRKELGLEDDLAERLQRATDYRQWELSSR